MPNDAVVAIVLHLCQSGRLPVHATIVSRTGADDFDKAEAILKTFYQNGGNQEELINDAFHIFGTEEVLYALDALQLDKIAEPTND